MDEEKVEKTPISTHTTVNRTETKSSGEGAMLAFAVGGVVVAVAILAYFVFGDGLTTTGAPGSSGGDVSVDVQTNEAPASESEPAPATEEAPAEAEPEPAPETQ